MKELKPTKELLPQIFGHSIPLIDSILHSISDDELTNLGKDGALEPPYCLLLEAFRLEREGSFQEARTAISNAVSEEGNDCEPRGRLILQVERCRLEFLYGSPSEFGQSVRDLRERFDLGKAELSDFLPSVLLHEANLMHQGSNYQAAFDIWEDYLGAIQEGDAMAIYLRIYGISNQALNLQKLGRHKASLEKHSFCLEQIDDHFGESHSLRASFIYDYANTLEQIGEIREAMQARDEALLIFDALPEQRHRDHGKAFHGRSSTLELAGRYEEALEDAIRSEELNVELLGDSHVLVAESNHRIASVLEKQGKLTDALRHRTRSLDIMREIFNEPHPKIALALNNIASLHGYGGSKNRKALSLHQESLEMFLATLGPEHPDSTFVMVNVGSKKSDLGRHEDGIAEIRKAFEIHQKLFGEEHPDNATFLINLGLCLNQFGKHMDAMKSWEKALALNSNAYGERHIETARAMSHVGSGILNTGGDAQKALSLAEKALSVLLDLTGEDSSDTIWARHALARCFGLVGRIEESIKMYRTAYHSARKTLGSKNYNAKYLKKALKSAEANAR